jgi:hypothetical protein
MTMGSLDDEDLANVSAQLVRETAESELRRSRIAQELTHGHSSMFGSIDEDSLLEASFRVEAELEVPAIPSPRPVLLSETASHASYSRRSPRTSFPPPTTPAPPRFQSAQTPDPAKSPSKLPFYIREIPEQHLFVEQISEQLQKFPYFILFMCCRIANDTGVSMSELMQGMSAADVESNPAGFWEALRSHSKVESKLRQESARVWSAARRNFEGYTFKGRIIFRDRMTDPVFGLQLLPIEPENSCRLQRKFGSHRFLYLDIPSFNSGSKTKPGRFVGDEMEKIHKEWKSWLHKEHTFLGRKWRAFHSEPIKKRQKAGRPKEDTSDYRMIMFATDGTGIEPISLGKMLNWFLPFARNGVQSFCKAYARLDLGLSRTISTLTFKPSQIRRVPDMKADGALEDSRFNDPTFGLERIAGTADHHERWVFPDVSRRGF